MLKPVEIIPAHKTHGPDFCKMWFSRDKATPLDGIWGIRGAICFPMLTHETIMSDQPIRGFALLAGQNLETAEIHIFHTRDWQSIDTILSDGAPTIRGLAPWISRLSATYYANKYYISQPDVIWRPYFREIIKSSECNPKPTFLETNNTDTWMNIWHFLSLKQLKYEAEGQLHIAVRNHGNAPAMPLGPELIALGALCAGLREYPLRPRRQI